jgi:hypothetical protein
LLGLVKHATFLEKVWFDEAVTCRSRAEIGIPAASGESFILHDDDTIASVQQAHREACESSRRATSSLGLDDRVYGYWRGPLPLRWVYLHVLRELAQHGGPPPKEEDVGQQVGPGQSAVTHDAGEVSARPRPAGRLAGAQDKRNRRSAIVA